MDRLSKDLYYINIAKAVAQRGTCLRRIYGAVIVKNDEIISTGYTGSPRDDDNCSELKVCTRNELNIPSGERYELCKSVHAEMNAIISASRSELLGSTLYLYGFDVSSRKCLNVTKPCSICHRLIKNAGISKVISYSDDTETLVSTIIYDKKRSHFS